MEPFFFDTSALAKRYVDEDGSDWVVNVFGDEDVSSVYIAETTTVELTAAVIRRSRGGSISLEEAEKILVDFDLHLLSDYYVLEITPEILLKARSLVIRHGLRGYDAVQLAVAETFNHNQNEMDLPSPTFISADGALLKAAQTDGFEVANPNAL